jgi:type IV pilus assembly protein PilB
MNPPGLGTLLIEAGLITEDQLAEALEDQKSSQERLGTILVRRKAITEDVLIRTLSVQLEIPPYDPNIHKVTSEAVTAVPHELARKYGVLPLSIENGRIQVAMSDPLNLDALDDLRAVTRKTVDPVIGPASLLGETRETHYGRLEGSRDIQAALAQASIHLNVPEVEDELDEEEAKKWSEDAPIVNLVNQVVSQAINERATDIHVEPQERDLIIRYRVDGLLYTALRPPRSVYTGVMTRIKILATMDISERRAPQAGRFSVRALDREVDVRVSTIPTIFGEKAVLRLLHKTGFDFSLNTLGYEDTDLKLFRDSIRQPFGMILLSGPTGSGKSTTLYAALQELRDPSVNIMTVEDPVEYHMGGINQTQVNERKGVSFAASLRTFLRQDPDVIMVGEIRDRETGEIAVRAAMTGHIVFSTIHANDAPSTAARLVTLGVESFQAASALNLVAAQRLVRRNCSFCAVPYTPPEEMLLAFGLHPEDLGDAQFKKGKGCAECKDRGYRGRVAIVELMKMDRAIRDLVAQNATSDAIRDAALARNMQTLKTSGLKKAQRGITTIEEVLRVCLDDS